MSDSDYPADPVTAVRKAVYYSDVDAIRRFFSEQSDLAARIRRAKNRIVCEAAKKSTPEAVRALIESGADVNEQDSNGATGLCWAVTYGRYDVARVLLQCGADPDIRCAIFGITDEDVSDPIAMAALLLDHGADINRPFLVEGLPARTILSRAVASGRSDLVEFLKSKGARLRDELPAEQAEVPSPKAAPDYAADVVAHFRRHYGKQQRKIIRQVVPGSDFPIAVHCIPSSTNKEELMVLFTSGLSRFEMAVPKGSEQYRSAELMVVLDKVWPRPEKAVKDAKWAWPIQWLFKIASYPVNQNTWLGAGLSTMAEEDPPRPLAQTTSFTSWLLVSLKSDQSVIRCKDGKTIQIYQLFPLYTDEYQYSRKHGADALMSLFIEREIPEHIALNRPSVVATKG